MGGKRRGKSGRGEEREEGDGRTNPKPAAMGLSVRAGGGHFEHDVKMM